ncbi:MAG: 2-octaprenyl-6-methoxyphenyl hydroxylase [Cellvibrionaceae bacterium]
MANKNVQKTEQQKIVIVGGGMVGVSLAIMLSQNFTQEQIAITLIEQFPLPANNALPLFQPSFDDRSTALSAGSVEILKNMDCWSSIASTAQAIQTVHVSDKGHFTGVQLNAADYGMEAVGYVIENRRLGQVLLHKLQEHNVECLAPASVSRCNPKKDGYLLTIEKAKEKETIEYHANLVLIADGANSSVRQSLGIDVEVTDYDQSALIANVALEKDHQNIAFERFTDEGPIALLPLPKIDGVFRAALVWTLPLSKQEGLLALDADTLLSVLQQRFGYRAGNIIELGETQCYPLKLVQAKEQVRSNMVVVGNAAHFLHPVAGQGFNLALRDCHTLVECLREANSQGKLLGNYATLKQYMQQQEKDQDITIYMTDSLVKLFSSSDLPLAVLRQLGFVGLNVLSPLKHQFAQRMMGLG